MKRLETLIKECNTKFESLTRWTTQDLKTKKWIARGFLIDNPLSEGDTPEEAVENLLKKIKQQKQNERIAQRLSRNDGGIE